MKKFYPVLHVLTSQQALEQSKLLFENGADGLFLISHEGDNKLVTSLVAEVKSKFPSLKVGINLLGRNALSAMEEAIEVKADMLWCDFAYVDSAWKRPLAHALSELSTTHGIPVFAGVAFKYQRHEPDPLKAAQYANELGFIATTSGTATGIEPDVDKIALMARTGNLAVASGLSVENVLKFKPFLTYFLVSTGLSYSMYDFDPQKVLKFSQLVKA